VYNLRNIPFMQGWFKAFAIYVAAWGLKNAGCISDHASNIFCM
jgi:hypothetical protein